jgi:phosphopantothenoylcysteine decarboxylase / phosphopantothenate---cysteine ligase
VKPKVLVTAGPTYEAIDPVRFIGNRSSGKMGYALAQELVLVGFEVYLISGPTNLARPTNLNFIAVESAEEMYIACKAVYPNCDLAIFAAAVADYTPKVVAKEKIKKNDDEFFIQLVKTKDIAKELGKEKRAHQVNIGFALETNNEEENAKKKLDSKNLDFVVLNSLQNQGTCFGVDDNQIIIIEKDKKTIFETKSKDLVAKDIVNYALQYKLVNK